MKKNRNDELKHKIETYYSAIYSKSVLKYNPRFMETYIHPDTMFKYKDTVYAIEATSYFYQQETDYSNRVYKKVLKFINDDDYIEKLYNLLGKGLSLNIINSIYYDNLLDLINDLIEYIDFIEEITLNKNVFYNSNIEYNMMINNKLENGNINKFFDKIDKTKNNYHFIVTLKKKYNIPIKIILDYDREIQYNNKRTLVPIISFKQNDYYNFKSLRSLIHNKENKLSNIYIPDLNNRNIKYDKFILLIHPIDYPLDIFPSIIYDKIKDLTKNTKYDEIAIILKNEIMVINNNYYKIYKEVL